MPVTISAPASAPAKKDAPQALRLGGYARDVVAGRLDRLDDRLAEFGRRYGPAFGPLAVELLGIVCAVVLPEEYGSPPAPAEATAENPGGPAKAAVILARHEAGEGMWHRGDPESPRKEAGLAAALRSQGLCRRCRKPQDLAKQWRREQAATKPSAPFPDRTKPDAPGPRGHPGMLRLDDAPEAPRGREYDPCEWTRKGDDHPDGECNVRGKRVALP